MRRIKITVVKMDYNADLARKYGDGVNGPCMLHQLNQEIYCERHYQPQEISGEAWKAMQHYVYALYHGSDLPLGRGWMRDPGVAIVTCNDGLRPVTFKLERVEE